MFHTKLYVTVLVLGVYHYYITTLYYTTSHQCLFMWEYLEQENRKTFLGRICKPFWHFVDNGARRSPTYRSSTCGSQYPAKPHILAPTSVPLWTRCVKSVLLCGHWQRLFLYVLSDGEISRKWREWALITASISNDFCEKISEFLHQEYWKVKVRLAPAACSFHCLLFWIWGLFRVV